MGALRRKVLFLHWLIGTRSCERTASITAAGVKRNAIIKNATNSTTSRIIASTFFTSSTSMIASDADTAPPDSSALPLVHRIFKMPSMLTYFSLQRAMCMIAPNTTGSSAVPTRQDATFRPRWKSRI